MQTVRPPLRPTPQPQVPYAGTRPSKQLRPAHTLRPLDLTRKAGKLESLLTVETCRESPVQKAACDVRDMAERLFEAGLEGTSSEDDCKVLDAAGTLPWNRSVFLNLDAGATGEASVTHIVADVRYAASLMLLISLPAEEQSDATCRALLIAAKTALSCLGAGDERRAKTVVELAADCEARLSACSGHQDTDQEVVEARAALFLARYAYESVSKTGSNAYCLSGESAV